MELIELVKNAASFPWKNLMKICPALLLFGLLVFQIKDLYDKTIDKEEGKGDLGRGIAT